MKSREKDASWRRMAKNLLNEPCTEHNQIFKYIIPLFEEQMNSKDKQISLFDQKHFPRWLFPHVEHFVNILR
jgi:hypothetical protein